ncbi:MAG: hypothetical protein MSH10_01050 [Pygmaiobacter massiliensis]|nr:hypothetical protein [Pygmaiobacter massiliensis]
MIEPDNHPQIESIYATIGHNGETFDSVISQNELSDELNNSLLELFFHTKIKRRLLPYPKNYTILDGSVYLTVRVLLDNADSLSLYVNLSSQSDYNSAQFGDTHFQIVEGQKLYEQVYSLLSDKLAVP